MPLGFPVVPEVYITVARSAAFTRAARAARSASSNSAPWLTIWSSERSPFRSAEACEKTTTSSSSGRPASDGSTFASWSSSETSSTRAPECRSMKTICSATAFAGSGKSTMPFVRQARSQSAASRQFSERIATFAAGSPSTRASTPRAIARVRRERSATVSSHASCPSTRRATVFGSVASRERSTSPRA